MNDYMSKLNKGIKGVKPSYGLKIETNKRGEITGAVGEGKLFLKIGDFLIDANKITIGNLIQYYKKTWTSKTDKRLQKKTRCLNKFFLFLFTL